MKEISTKIFYQEPMSLEESKAKRYPMFNPISYDVMNSDLLEDGMYILKNFLKEDFEVDLIFEVKNKKVVKVYKNETIRRK